MPPKSQRYWYTSPFRTTSAVIYRNHPEMVFETRFKDQFRISGKQLVGLGSFPFSFAKYRLSLFDDPRVPMLSLVWLVPACPAQPHQLSHDLPVCTRLFCSVKKVGCKQPKCADVKSECQVNETANIINKQNININITINPSVSLWANIIYRSITTEN